MIFIDELKKVSSKIDAIIQSDDYPSKILPEHLKQAVLQYPSNAGKRLRPALTLWSCGLLGGDLEKAYYAATAAEIYHNWTLVHDDIIDEDDLRRGNPATHITLKEYAEKKYSLDNMSAKKFGIDFAILAGDLQQSWAMSLLMKSSEKGLPPNVILSICKDMTDVLSRELISGEAIDVEMSYRNFDKVTSEEVEEMIYFKTGALLNFSVITGAKIALETDEKKDKRILKLADYASSVGIAFQLKDDWLGIFSNTEELGKPAGSDITSSKPTSLMLTALKNSNNENRQKLKSYLGQTDISGSVLETIRSLIRESGAEKIILNKINNLHTYSNKCLSNFPENKYKKILLELNHYLNNRTK